MNQTLNWKTVMLDQIYNLVAGFLYAAAISYFAGGADFAPGGVSGIALICNHLWRWPIGLVTVLINIPLALGSVFFVGKLFLIRSMISTVYCAAFQDLLFSRLPTYSGDPLLAALFTGVLWGAAMALLYMRGSSSGGTDFIAIYMSEKKGIDSWNMIFGLNAVILVAAGLLFGWDKALYSIIFQFTSTQVLHMTYKRYQQQTLFVVTNRPDMVAEVISHLSHHGATVIDAEGSYEHKDRKIVYSVVASDESKSIIHAVKVADPHAFINVVKTQQVSGRFYQRPTD